MYERKCNMIRSVCRSLEILLFFVISIVGFGLFAKTSFNTKTKSKSFIGGTVVPRELSQPDNTLRGNSSNFYSFFITSHQESSSSSSKNSVDGSLCGIMPDRHIPLPYGCSVKNNRPLLSLLNQPANLFQQNPVLLI
jgi:hypothetical protein